MLTDEKSLGEKIKEARLKNNLSQQALADKLFITPQAVSKWENNRSLPDINTIQTLEKILEVSIIGELPHEIEENETIEVEKIEELTSTNLDLKKNWYAYVLVTLNYLWLLFCLKFFMYEHPLIQYAILFFCYFGIIFLLSTIIKKYSDFSFLKHLILVVNLLIFIAIIITQLVV